MFELNLAGQQFVLLWAVGFALVFWLWGKLRYDLVALIALLILVVFGVVPAGEMFVGFSAPAVIIVAAVLVMTQGMMNSGLTYVVMAKLPLAKQSVSVQLLVLTSLTAMISAFVYNIGALALMIPIAVGLARKKGVSASYYLMPVAFAAHMGGFLTLVGNAPNIIVSEFRVSSGMEPYNLFDFAGVGGWLVVASVLFISFVGWRLIPERKPKIDKKDLFEVEGYTAELRVGAESGALNKNVGQIKREVKEKFEILALIREGKKHDEVEKTAMLREGDVLLVKAEPQVLEAVVTIEGLELVGPGQTDEKEVEAEGEEEVEVKDVEAVVVPGSRLVGLQINLPHGVQLVAVSRQDQEIRDELAEVVFRPGDVLMLRGRDEQISTVLSLYKLLPLAERAVNLEGLGRVALAVGVFGVAISLSVLRVLPVEVSFMVGAILTVLVGLVSMRQAYESVDWSVVVLLGAMIPFGRALTTSGAADLITSGFLGMMGEVPIWVILAVVLGVSMLLSDLVNNVGVAVLMAPIALLLAEGLGVSADPLLMAVAIGGSCAFMTPVGHQVNVLVMGPGGYRFSDYWRMGLWLNLIIFGLGLWLVPVVWGW